MKSKNTFSTIWPDQAALAEAAAHYFITTCRESVGTNGIFTAALSGGHTPEIFYSLLATLKYSRNIPWNKVHLFWSDERWVKHESPESNYRMAKEMLLDYIPIASKNIHPVPVSGSPAKGAARYEKTIKKVLGSQNPAFDWLMLGVGADGHTASLFPGTAVLKEKKRFVSEVFIKENNSWRISFTYALINKASKIIFLVSGKEKAPVIEKIFNPHGKKMILPVCGVKPEKGQICWMLDRDAATGIRKLI